MSDTTELEWRISGAEGEWYDRLAASQDLPALAVDALLAGWDGPTLCVLAGEPAGAFGPHVGELFARAMVELGRPVPTRSQARRAYVRYLAWLIDTRRVSAIDGAQRLERTQHWELDELGHVSGLVDEWAGGWGRTREEVEREIRRTARALIAT
jgi:hypothetical protein